MLTVYALTFLCPAARADHAVGSHDWDSGPHNWTNEYFDWTSVGHELSGGNPEGWLRITFPEIDPFTYPEEEQDRWYDVVHTPAADLFAGSWDSSMWIEFDFWASNQVPHDLQLQFHSTNDNVWGYNILSQAQATQEWQTITVSLEYTDPWGPLPGFDDSLDQYLDDLASIDWIGVYIWRDEPGIENYGIDNMNLMVPEPAEWVLLGTALAVSFLAIRKRRPPREERDADHFSGVSGMGGDSASG